MIVHPILWKNVGQPIIYYEIERRLIEVISQIGCKNLSLSGGLDSSYMLYCMIQAFKVDEIDTYTIVGGEKHPDYNYSKMITDYFGVNWHPIILQDIIPSNENQEMKGKYPGDLVVSIFYDHLPLIGVSEIIACDGIDEFMCGYYAHQKSPTNEVYYNFLKALRDEHLIPLDENSGRVKVYLPYIDERLVNLYTQIPISDKVDSNSRKKVMRILAKEKIPKEIIHRRKYGFCDAGLLTCRTSTIKEGELK